MAWEFNKSGLIQNEILQGENFYISYNPDCGASLFEGGNPETALCHEDKYYILNGDFRAAYERLVPEGFKACMNFYKQQSAHAESSWSSKKG